MLREKAFDFWKTYIGLKTKCGVDVTMTNPAVTFTADAKAGEYDDISDEEYYELLDFTEELASFWKKNREATAGAVLLEALVNTDLSLSETDKLAQILAEASERKTYKYIKPEPEFEKAFDKTPFDEGEVEWTPQMIYEYLNEHVYRQENAKKAAAIMLYNHLKGRRRNMILAGPTGCGKTTMINLLMRFYDTDSGEIDVSGHPITEITRDSLRASYGMVLQETWLKHATIRENIAMGKPEATKEEIIEAAKASHAHGFIKRLPEGYDTILGEDGGSLSQGQKQLLCIARVMLCLPPMLILDEATSSIDTRTELKIQNAFAKMMEGRTSFIVAHRLSTIQEADVILVMKDGKIIEKGNHEELLAAGGFYATLYQSQFAV